MLTNVQIASSGQPSASAAGSLDKMLLQLLLPDRGPFTQSLTHRRRAALHSVGIEPQFGQVRSANKIPLLAAPSMTVGLLLSSCKNHKTSASLHHHAQLFRHADDAPAPQ